MALNNQQWLICHKTQSNVGHMAAETAKKICCMKNKGAVDRCRVTRWVKRFCLGCKNHNDWARSSSPKTFDNIMGLKN